MTITADAFRKANALRGNVPRCKIALLLPKLTTKDRSALNAALDDAEITAVAIADVLRAEGHDISQHSISRHRKRGCRCAR